MFAFTLRFTVRSLWGIHIPWRIISPENCWLDTNAKLIHPTTIRSTILVAEWRRDLVVGPNVSPWCCFFRSLQHRQMSFLVFTLTSCNSSSTLSPKSDTAFSPNRPFQSSGTMPCNNSGPNHPRRALWPWATKRRLFGGIGIKEKRAYQGFANWPSRVGESVIPIGTLSFFC
jgi:hypothetical protein